MFADDGTDIGERRRMMLEDSQVIAVLACPGDTAQVSSPRKGMESLGTGGVPVSLLCHYGHFLAGEAVLEEIENGKLVSRHDVGVWVSLDLGPDVREGRL